MAWFYIPLLMIVCSVADIANSHSFDFSRRLRLLDPPTDGNVGVKIIENQYFEQKIDNFNPIDTRVWNQRYHINEDYYNESSKNHVFLMLGGEWEATTGWLTSGGWVESAKKYGALLFYLEHRYYGSSQPFEDLSTENLQFLNAHQALEDAANFIQGMNEKYNLSATEAKWIVFGGSYAGTLASWIRHKYPHLVAGAVDSSGPLEAVLDFHQYLQVVREGFATHSESCVSNIKEAFDELDQLVGGCLEDEEIYEELNSIFQLCDSIELSEGNEQDLSSLFELMVDNDFAYPVQYNSRNYIASIDNVCGIMTNETIGTPLYRLAEVNRVLLEYFGDSCFSYKYEDFVVYHQNTTLSSSSMGRQWLYQTCTEYGFFQTSTQEDPVFSSRFNINFFTDLCIDVFGSQFNETLTLQGIHSTNVRYGGVTAPISNVVHFHGKIDPWHALGKLETTEDAGDSVIIVDDASHCDSMYVVSDYDSEELVSAKQEIDRLVGLWLEGGSSESKQSRGSTTIALCDSLELSDGNEKDLATLFEVIANDNFAHVVQYNGRYEITIDTICDILTNETDASTSLEKLGKVNSLNLLDSGKNCTSYKYEELVSFHQNTLFGSNSMSRQWLYQTCTEYGFFQTTTQADPIFSSRFNATYFVDICTDVFGNLFQESLISAGIKVTNVRYGGSKAPIGNIVHFHGTLDPWHVLGKLEASDDVEDTVLVVDGVSLCASMYTTYSTEVEELNNAKREIDRLVGMWLGVTSQKNGSNFVVIYSSYMLYIVLLMHVLLLLVLKL